MFFQMANNLIFRGFNGLKYTFWVILIFSLNSACAQNYYYINILDSIVGESACWNDNISHPSNSKYWNLKEMPLEPGVYTLSYFPFLKSNFNLFVTEIDTNKYKKEYGVTQLNGYSDGIVYNSSKTYIENTDAINRDSQVYINTNIIIRHILAKEVVNVKLITFKKNGQFDCTIDSFVVTNRDLSTSPNEEIRDYTVRIGYSSINCAVDLEVITNSGQKFKITELTPRKAKIGYYDKPIYDLYSYRVNGRLHIQCDKIVLDNNESKLKRRKWKKPCVGCDVFE